jgi:hypothetical protein
MMARLLGFMVLLLAIVSPALAQTAAGFGDNADSATISSPSATPWQEIRPVADSSKSLHLPQSPPAVPAGLALQKRQGDTPTKHEFCAGK